MFESRSGHKFHSLVPDVFILFFEKFLFAEGLSKARVLKYLNQMNAVAEWANFELDSATKEDIEYIVGIVARSELADWTINELIVPKKTEYRKISRIFPDPLFS